MRFTFQLVTLDPEFGAIASAKFADVSGFTGCHVGDVRILPRDGVAFVSPANSLGFMDGGIDYVYSRNMWPGCERAVRSAIRTLDNRTQLGRSYLRIGSALWISVGSNSALISAPTMFMPHDVSMTQNAYWAMMAVLMLMDRNVASGTTTINHLVCPSLCCGWGKMDATEAATQMARAVSDFEAGNRPPAEDVTLRPEHGHGHGPGPGPGHKNTYMILPSRDADQPAIYDNREIGVGFRA